MRSNVQPAHVPEPPELHLAGGTEGRALALTGEETRCRGRVGRLRRREARRRRRRQEPCQRHRDSLCVLLTAREGTMKGGVEVRKSSTHARFKASEISTLKVTNYFVVYSWRGFRAPGVLPLRFSCARAPSPESRGIRCEGLS